MDFPVAASEAPPAPLAALHRPLVSRCRAQAKVALDPNLAVSCRIILIDLNQGVDAIDAAFRGDLTSERMTFAIGLANGLMVCWQGIDKPKVDVPIGFQTGIAGVRAFTRCHVAKPSFDSHVALTPV